jgi:hypothetical protein
MSDIKPGLTTSTTIYGAPVFDQYYDVDLGGNVVELVQRGPIDIESIDLRDTAFGRLTKPDHNDNLCCTGVLDIQFARRLSPADKELFLQRNVDDHCIALGKHLKQWYDDDEPVSNAWPIFDEEPVDSATALLSDGAGHCFGEELDTDQTTEFHCWCYWAATSTTTPSPASITPPTLGCDPSAADCAAATSSIKEKVLANTRTKCSMLVLNRGAYYVPNLPQALPVGFTRSTSSAPALAPGTTASSPLLNRAPLPHHDVRYLHAVYQAMFLLHEICRRFDAVDAQFDQHFARLPQPQAEEVDEPYCDAVRPLPPLPLVEEPYRDVVSPVLHPPVVYEPHRDWREQPRGNEALDVVCELYRDRHEQTHGYEAPDAPSFSLGSDDDIDVMEELHIPMRGGRPKKQVHESAATVLPGLQRRRQRW